jgi:hypothetical protein
VDCTPRGHQSLFNTIQFSDYVREELMEIGGLLCGVSRSDANIGEGMKKPEHVEKPQDHGDYNDGIQDRLDRPLHRDESIDQPQQNTHYDQNHH